MMTAPDRGKTPNVSPPVGRRTRGSAVAAGDPRGSPVISQDRARSVTTLRDRGRAELQGCKAMTETIIMRGAYAITDPCLGASGVIPDGAVVIVDGTIRETGPFDAIVPKYPDIGVIGDGTQLLMPGLVDAHSHGRGLSPTQKGVRNDFLENALFDWAYMPILPPELTAAICALRHLRSGCTLLHHNGFDDDGFEGARRAHIAIRTYLSTGIRLAFSPGVRDESKLAMD